MLSTVGARVRALRDEHGLSRRQLSEKSGLSERFLAQLEGGKGNISLSRFADVAFALGTTPSALLEGASDGTNRNIIALLGLRGAGKSSVGQGLATQRGIPFIEVDRRIEDAAGLSLGQIFELHGEGYYRRLETEVLADLLGQSQPMVIATGGSIVNHRDNFDLLKRSSCTVWLKAKAQDHWNRVIEQGDQRPMAENPHAFSELSTLLAERESLYASANLIIDTSGKSIGDVVSQLSEATS